MGISWHSAKKYCEWLSLKTGDFYRLPTEAEWEYACRAGSSTAYSFGNDTKDIEEYVWFDKNSGDRTNKVGLKRPNAFGLYDMHGNVWEFCLDYYDPNYYKTLKDEITINPKGPENGKVPVIRGGSWNDPPSELRCANRKYVPSEWWERDPMLPRGIWWLVDGQYVGLRVVRPINP
jgi:formylglycine-generating enzyme required for sulfatase activity